MEGASFAAGAFVALIVFFVMSVNGAFNTWNPETIEKCRDKQEWCAEEMPRLYGALFPSPPQEKGDG